MIYIASPYSAPKGTPPDEASKIRHSNYIAVRDFQASVFKYDPRLAAISPIVLMHDLAQVHVMPTHAEPYWEFNKALMDAAKHIMVLRLTGWDNSVGVAMEINYAIEQEYKILYVDPETYIGLNAN